ncbi:alpha/beta-hydrolase [Marasmius fiardii PR-910]|nr:alpha/beta-hydrolase [Marasmius fiardii PR-910]
MTSTSYTYTLSDNIQIFFTDSGPPPKSNDYTTLIVLHGSGFNGFGLKKLHSFAHQFNLRTVIWNRRDYPGSTAYTDSELEDLRQRPDVFMNRIGRLVGEFLVQFIENENIPKTTSDHKRGGIAIMGWSMGGPSAMALFSDPKLMPPETYLKMEPYVKDLVLDDPSHVCFGYGLPKYLPYYYPLEDPDLKTPHEKYQQFSVWISSFFDHRDPDSGDLHFLDVMMMMSNDATTTKWSKEELELYFNEEAAVRTEIPMYSEAMQRTLRRMAEQVFFNTNLVESYFPRLKVTMVYGTKSPWHCLWAHQELRKTHRERVSKGMTTRSMTFYKMLHANHFVHWENPTLLLETTAEGIRR